MPAQAIIPDWVQSAVFYEIYPQTFQDSNGDGVGDLPGATSRLDYIASLGTTAIWLNPIYCSPMRDAGYDVSNFREVDPRYGTIEDLQSFISEAHRRGIRVLLDFVPGHTSIDHSWFQHSASAEENPFSHWYIWTGSAWDDGGPEWRSRMVHGYSNRNGNYLVNFFWSQPALNFGFADPDPACPWQLPTTHPDVRRLWDEMRDIMVFWMKQGADGFRVDMAGSITRRDPGGREARRFWTESRSACEAVNPEYFTVAEWSNPKSALDGSGLHADFLHWIPSYENLFRKERERTPGGPEREAGHSWFDRLGKGDIRAFMDDYLLHYHATCEKGCISIPIGNHDLPRIGIGRNVDDLEIIFAFLLTMPGVPFIYNGDEIAMPQVHGVPVREGSYPPRSGARTPMLWDETEPNWGFSTADPSRLWAPQATQASSARQQEADPDSLLQRVKRLIRIRRTEAALRATSGFRLVYCKRNAYPLVYLRSTGDQSLLVVLNPSAAEVEAEIPVLLFPADSPIAGSPIELDQCGPDTTRLAIAGASFSILPVKSPTAQCAVIEMAL